MTVRDHLRRALLVLPCLAAVVALAGCEHAELGAGSGASDDDAPAAVPGEVHLEASADLFADASFEAHAEAAAPGVVASIDVEAWGSATVDARVIASAAGGAVVLGELRGAAAMTIEGGIALDGRIAIDLPGMSYDGPIPGLADQELRFEGAGLVETLSSASGSAGGSGGGAARADLAPGDRPGVDLPGFDGRVAVAIGEGSFVTTTLVAECATADEDTVEIRARLVTSGKLVLRPSLEVDASVLGPQSLALAEVEVAIDGETSVVMRADVAELASETAAVEARLPTCR